MNDYSPEFEASQALVAMQSFGDFIGRQRQLMEVEEHLQTKRLVTVVGPGGMGKTRLALEFLKRKREGATRDTAMAFVSFGTLSSNI